MFETSRRPIPCKRTHQSALACNIHRRRHEKIRNDGGHNMHWRANLCGLKSFQRPDRQTNSAGLFFPDVRGTFAAQSANMARKQPLRGGGRAQGTAEITRPRFMTGQCGGGAQVKETRCRRFVFEQICAPSLSLIRGTVHP